MQLTLEQVQELRERSKDDRAIIVGSEVRQLCALAESFLEESQWIRKKLNLPADTPFVSGMGQTVAGAMHVVCSHAYGYMTYITSYQCNDKQGEIARLTVRVRELEKELADLKQSVNDAADRGERFRCG
jgi:hypothetical protein